MKEIVARVRSVNPKLLFNVFCWVAALAKLALVATNEIIADADDSAVYADQSLRYWTMGFPQGYPIWLRVGQFFGIPQRVAVEFLYLAVVVILGFAIKRYFGLLAAYLTVGLLALSPTSYYLFDIGFTDGFSMSLSLLALALTLHLFTGSRVKRNSLALGAVLGVLAITRNEDPLLALWLFSLIVGCAVLWRESDTSIWHLRLWRKPVQAGVIVTVIASAIVCALATSYYIVDGVFACGVATIPGHTRLLTNLARIRTGEPQLRYIPISRRSRELAYQVSPTLAKYRQLVENPADSWQVLSRNAGLPTGEIGGGWIWHAINMKVLEQAKGRPGNAQIEYNKINTEVEAAFRDGRLKRRFILQPLIGGDMKGLLTAIPASLSRVIAATFRPEIDKGPRVFVPELFDRAYVRRASLSPRTSDLYVQGWAYINKPGRTIKRLVVSSDLVADAGLTTGDRSDVTKYLQGRYGWRPEVLGFAGRVKNKSPDSLKITYTLDSEAQVQGEQLQSAQAAHLRSNDFPGEEVIQNIDFVKLADEPVESKAKWVEERLYRSARKWRLHIWGSGLVLAAIFLSLYKGLILKDQRWRLYAVFFAFASLSWVARILVYTLIDARAWDGAQSRYLAPANALGVVMFCVAVGAFASLLRSDVTNVQRLRRAEEPLEDRVAT